MNAYRSIKVSLDPHILSKDSSYSSSIIFHSHTQDYETPTILSSVVRFFSLVKNLP